MPMERRGVVLASIPRRKQGFHGVGVGGLGLGSHGVGAGSLGLGVGGTLGPDSHCVAAGSFRPSAGGSLGADSHGVAVGDPGLGAGGTLLPRAGASSHCLAVGGSGSSGSGSSVGTLVPSFGATASSHGVATSVPGGGIMSFGGPSVRDRQSNWTHDEVMVLIREKRIELEQYKGTSDRERMVCLKEKWERISARLQVEGYDRDPEKSVKLYDHSTGCGNYFALTTKERSAAKLRIIEKEAFDEIDEFLSAKPNITPAKLRNNISRPPTRSGGSGNGSRSSNFGTGIENEDRGTAEEVHSPLLQQENLGNKEARSTGRAKKKARRSDLLALADVLKEGNEALLKMFTVAEETRLKLHQEQMELEKESIHLEQD
ncbi:hypothetical protein SELMODRAFT_420227 [Selaginella moellendorffii]|uniref:Myb-like domain-containing protein n=1 Tax=Selaginella moellendorffii TaxID=88036 RepID=D8SBC1_SELML|nr:hypothetical protein SELMODRAFT_420227 [Selaginella moellendorffii]